MDEKPDTEKRESTAVNENGSVGFVNGTEKRDVDGTSKERSDKGGVVRVLMSKLSPGRVVVRGTDEVISVTCTENQGI